MNYMLLFRVTFLLICWHLLFIEIPNIKSHCSYAINGFIFLKAGCCLNFDYSVNVDFEYISKIKNIDSFIICILFVISDEVPETYKHIKLWD